MYFCVRNISFSDRNHNRTFYECTIPTVNRDLRKEEGENLDFLSHKTTME